MKLELSRVYGNQPYYTIYSDNGDIGYALGFENARKFIDEAGARGEKIEIENLGFLVEHVQLMELLNSGGKNESKKQ